MMEIEGNKERTALAMAFARMWQDPQYKQELISDPKMVLRREGVNFSANTSVRVVEETRNITYMDLEKEELDLRRCTPISEGREVRIVQSTANLRYLVLPATPGWIAPGTQTTGNLLAIYFIYSFINAIAFLKASSANSLLYLGLLGLANAWSALYAFTSKLFFAVFILTSNFDTTSLLIHWSCSGQTNKTGAFNVFIFSMFSSGIP